MEKGVKIANIDLIREISRDFGVYTDQELRALLKFYHSLGKIIYFGISLIALIHLFYSFKTFSGPPLDTKI